MIRVILFVGLIVALAMFISSLQAVLNVQIVGGILQVIAFQFVEMLAGAVFFVLFMKVVSGDTK